MKEFKLTVKLLTLELTRKEWEIIKNRRTGEPENRRTEHFVSGSPIHRFSGSALEFYHLAESRDRVFMETVAETLKAKRHSVAVLITGGFHTDALRDYFNEHQWSYAVISPEVDQAKRENYFKAILGRGPQDIEVSEVSTVAYALGKAAARSLGVDVDKREALTKAIAQTRSLHTKDFPDLYEAMAHLFDLQRRTGSPLERGGAERRGVLLPSHTPSPSATPLSRGELKWEPFFKIIEDGSIVTYAVFLPGQTKPKLFQGDVPREILAKAEWIFIHNLKRATRPGLAGLNRHRLDVNDPATQKLIPEVVRSVPHQVYAEWEGPGGRRWWLIFNPYPIWPPKEGKPLAQQPFHMTLSRADGRVYQTEIIERENLGDLFACLSELNQSQSLREEGGELFRLTVNGWYHSDAPDAPKAGASQSQALAQLMRFPFPIEKARLKERLRLGPVKVSTLADGIRTGLVFESDPEARELLVDLVFETLRKITEKGHSFNIIAVSGANGSLRVFVADRVLGIPPNYPERDDFGYSEFGGVFVIDNPERFGRKDAFRPDAIQALRMITAPQSEIDAIIDHLEKYIRSSAQAGASSLGEADRNRELILRIQKAFHTLEPGQVRDIGDVSPLIHLTGGLLQWNFPRPDGEKLGKQQSFGAGENLASVRLVIRKNDEGKLILAFYYRKAKKGEEEKSPALVYWEEGKYLTQKQYLVKRIRSAFNTLKVGESQEIGDVSPLIQLSKGVLQWIFPRPDGGNLRKQQYFWAGENLASVRLVILRNALGRWVLEFWYRKEGKLKESSVPARLTWDEKDYVRYFDESARPVIYVPEGEEASASSLGEADQKRELISPRQKDLSAVTNLVGGPETLDCLNRIREVVNPGSAIQGRKKVLYVGSGADISTALLATDATDLIFVDLLPFSAEVFHAEKIRRYLADKNGRGGYAKEQTLSLVGAIRPFLEKELEILKAENVDISGPDEKDSRIFTITFDWKGASRRLVYIGERDGKEIKTYASYLTDSRTGEGDLDFYLEKSGLELSSGEDPGRDEKAKIKWRIARRFLKVGGFLILDSHSNHLSEDPRGEFHEIPVEARGAKFGYSEAFVFQKVFQPKGASLGKSIRERLREAHEAKRVQVITSPEFQRRLKDQIGYEGADWRSKKSFPVNRGLEEYSREHNLDWSRKIREMTEAPFMHSKEIPLRILIIGMGRGRAAIDIKRLFGDKVEVHGTCLISYDEATTDELKEAGVLAHEGVVAEDLTQFKDQTFDLVISTHAFQYVLDPLLALEEIHRVLKPHGFASVFPLWPQKVTLITQKKKGDLGDIFEKLIQEAKQKGWGIDIERTGVEIVDRPVSEGVIQSTAVRLNRLRKEPQLLFPLEWAEEWWTYKPSPELQEIHQALNEALSSAARGASLGDKPNADREPSQAFPITRGGARIGSRQEALVALGSEKGPLLYVNAGKVAWITPEGEQSDAVIIDPELLSEKERSLGTKNLKRALSRGSLPSIPLSKELEELEKSVVLGHPFERQEGSYGEAFFVNVRDPKSEALREVLGNPPPGEVRRVYLKISKPGTGRSKRFATIQKLHHLQRFMAKTCRLKNPQEFKELGLDYERYRNLEVYIQEPVVVLGAVMKDVLRQSNSTEKAKYLISEFVRRVEELWRSRFIDMDSRPDNWGYNSEGRLVFHDFDYTYTSDQFEKETFDIKRGVFVNYIAVNYASLVKMDSTMDLALHFINEVEKTPFIKEILDESGESNKSDVLAQQHPDLDFRSLIRRGEFKTYEERLSAFAFFFEAVKKREKELATLFRTVPPRRYTTRVSRRWASEQEQFKALWAKKYLEPYQNYGEKKRRYEELHAEWEQWRAKASRSLNWLDRYFPGFSGFAQVHVGADVPEFQLRLKGVSPLHLVVLRETGASGEFIRLIDISAADGKPTRSFLLTVCERGKLDVWKWVNTREGRKKVKLEDEAQVVPASKETGTVRVINGEGERTVTLSQTDEKTLTIPPDVFSGKVTPVPDEGTPTPKKQTDRFSEAEIRKGLDWLGEESPLERAGYPQSGSSEADGVCEAVTHPGAPRHPSQEGTLIQLTEEALQKGYQLLVPNSLSAPNPSPGHAEFLRKISMAIAAAPRRTETTRFVADPNGFWILEPRPFHEDPQGKVFRAKAYHEGGGWEAIDIREERINGTAAVRFVPVKPPTPDPDKKASGKSLGAWSFGERDVEGILAMNLDVTGQVIAREDLTLEGFLEYLLSIRPLQAEEPTERPHDWEAAVEAVMDPLLRGVDAQRTGCVSSLPLGFVVTEAMAKKPGAAKAIVESLRHIPGSRIVLVWDLDDPAKQFVERPEYFKELVRLAYENGLQVKDLRTSDPQAGELKLLLKGYDTGLSVETIEDSHSIPEVRGNFSRFKLDEETLLQAGFDRRFILRLVTRLAQASDPGLRRQLYQAADFEEQGDGSWLVSEKFVKYLERFQKAAQRLARAA